MNRNNKWIGLIITGIAASVLLSLPAFGGSSHDEKHQRAEENKHRHGGNPLIEEMIKLDSVFRDVVSGVAMGDGIRVHAALESMHGAMEKTHEGVHQGTVTLKKNADRLKEFVAQDKEFHEKLERLAHAAHKNDQKTMLALTKDLLDRCVKCHRDFREP